MLSALQIGLYSLVGTLERDARFFNYNQAKFLERLFPPSWAAHFRRANFTHIH
jgi:hypothetical protein